MFFYDKALKFLHHADAEADHIYFMTFGANKCYSLRSAICKCAEAQPQVIAGLRC